MKQVLYDEIIQFISCHSSKSLQKVLHDLKEEYEVYCPYSTLMSICLTHTQQIIKKTYADKSTDEMVHIYYKIYKKKTEPDLKTDECSGSKGSILLKIAEDFSVPPALLARLVLKEYLCCNGTEIGSTEETFHLKSELSSMLKNPFRIPDTRLSYEVRQCIIHDICYGSVTDSIRHMVGVEYEDTLLKHMKDLNIPYQDETELRKLGYDKTPDIKLEIPIAVNGQVVCWIESKALFGTPENHKHYLNDQYFSYWNRFGPGLVIYWFGFVDELAGDMQRQEIILMDKFPHSSCITHFNPSSISLAKTLL